MRHKASNIFFGGFIVSTIVSPLLNPVIYLGVVIGFGIWAYLIHLEND